MLFTALGVRVALRRQRQGLPRGAPAALAARAGGVGRVTQVEIVGNEVGAAAKASGSSGWGLGWGWSCLFPVRTELSKVLAPGCCLSGAQPWSEQWLQGSQEVSKSK